MCFLKCELLKTIPWANNKIIKILLLVFSFSQKQSYLESWALLYSRWYFQPYDNVLLVHLTLGLALPILLLQNMRIYICSLSGVKSLCLNFWRLRKVRTPPLITTDWILLSKSYLHVREARSHLMWNSWKLTLTWLTPAVSPESESEDLKIFSRYTLRGGTCRAGHPWEKSVWRGGERRLTGQGELTHRRQSQVSTIIWLLSN